MSKRMFQNIIKILKYQTFSKLAVLHPPFTCKPLKPLKNVCICLQYEPKLGGGWPLLEGGFYYNFIGKYGKSLANLFCKLYVNKYKK